MKRSIPAFRPIPSSPRRRAWHRAGIEVEHREEVIFSLVGPGRDDVSALELQGDADQLASRPADREAAPELPLRAGLDRPGEDLARGHVAPAVGIDPGPAVDGERQVGPVGLDPDLLDARHELDEPRLSTPERLPGVDRVGAIEEHRRGDVRLIFGRLHPRVGGVGGRRELGQDPALPSYQLPEGGPGPVDHRLSLRVDAPHRSGVGLGRDPDPAVADLGLADRDGREMRELILGRVREEEFAEPRQVDPDDRVRPAPDDLAIARLDQRPGLQLGGDQDRLPGLDPEAVVDQERRPSGDEVVGHCARFPTPRTRGVRRNSW